MLANAVECWLCAGKGSYRIVTPHAESFPLIREQKRRLTCARCHGSGQLCDDCHKPEGVCECVQGEPCPKCGKGSCRCE